MVVIVMLMIYWSGHHPFDMMILWHCDGSDDGAAMIVLMIVNRS